MVSDIHQRQTIKPTKWRALSKDSGQPGHPPSLARDFAVRIKKPQVLSYPLSASIDSDQSGRMPRLVLVFAWRTCHFVGFLSWRGSVMTNYHTLLAKASQIEGLIIIQLQMQRNAWPGVSRDRLLESAAPCKKISNDQELIQSDPTSCPQNQKGNN